MRLGARHGGSLATARGGEGRMRDQPGAPVPSAEASLVLSGVHIRLTHLDCRGLSPGSPTPSPTCLSVCPLLAHRRDSCAAVTKHSRPARPRLLFSHHLTLIRALLPRGREGRRLRLRFSLFISSAHFLGLCHTAAPSEKWVQPNHLLSSLLCGPGAVPRRGDSCLTHSPGNQPQAGKQAVLCLRFLICKIG